MSKFFGKSRSEKRAENNLGIKHSTLTKGSGVEYRKKSLDTICKYVGGTQYDHLADWDVSKEAEGYVSVRKRKPKIIIFRFRFSTIPPRSTKVKVIVPISHIYIPEVDHVAKSELIRKTQSSKVLLFNIETELTLVTPACNTSSPKASP